MDSDDDAEEWIPPANFCMVERGLYRSGFPKKKNFPFLRHLRLKTILTLVEEDYPEANLTFMKRNGIRLIQIGVKGNKEPTVDIPEDHIVCALEHVLDRRNHPMLIHCNKGKRWRLTCIFDEYRRHARPKERFLDQQFIELFDPGPVRVLREHAPQWAGLTFRNETLTTAQLFSWGTPRLPPAAAAGEKE